jgi:AcrR family transcriptional regulator
MEGAAQTTHVLPRGRHAAPRRVVRQSQRARLLDAIAAAVAERGYARASVADVIALAGVSRKTFYEHFANKEECFLAAYDAGVEMVLEAIDSAVSEAGDPYSAAAAGTRAYVDTLASHPTLARSFFVEVLAAGDVVMRRRDLVLERFADQLERIYAGAREVLDVLPAAPPRYVFRACVGAVNELVTAELRRAGPSALPAIADSLLEVEMRLLVGHELAESIRTSAGLGEPARARSTG